LDSWRCTSGGLTGTVKREVDVGHSPDFVAAHTGVTDDHLHGALTALTLECFCCLLEVQVDFVRATLNGEWENVFLLCFAVFNNDHRLFDRGGLLRLPGFRKTEFHGEPLAGVHVNNSIESLAVFHLVDFQNLRALRMDQGHLAVLDGNVFVDLHWELNSCMAAQLGVAATVQGQTHLMQPVMLNLTAQVNLKQTVGALASLLLTALLLDTRRLANIHAHGLVHVDTVWPCRHGLALAHRERRKFLLGLAERATVHVLEAPHRDLGALDWLTQWVGYSDDGLLASIADGGALVDADDCGDVQLV
jgi:hypothetical protein